MHIQKISLSHATQIHLFAFAKYLLLFHLLSRLLPYRFSSPHFVLSHTHNTHTEINTTTFSHKYTRLSLCIVWSIILCVFQQHRNNPAHTHTHSRYNIRVSFIDDGNFVFFLISVIQFTHCIHRVSNKLGFQSKLKVF